MVERTPPGSASSALPGRLSGEAWVLIDDGDIRSLGASLAWAAHKGVAELHVLVSAAQRHLGKLDPLEVVSRRASCFREPAVEVWEVQGRELIPTWPASAGLKRVGREPQVAGWGDPGSLARPRWDEPRASADELGGEPSRAREALDGAGALGADALGFVDLLLAHGADPVIEHGVLKGEVLGLEVARVVPTEDGCRLSVGVGRLDRAARDELRPNQDLGEALDEAISLVRKWRRPGVGRHPANTLARERWLRSVLCSRPYLVGASWLKPVPPPLPHEDLRRPCPAPALGRTPEGESLLVVCSTGIDFDLVPTAADCRALLGADTRLALALTEGDDHPVTRRLVQGLVEPGEVLTVPRELLQ